MQADPRDQRIEELQAPKAQLRAANKALNAEARKLCELIHQLHERIEQLERQAARQAPPFRRQDKDRQPPEQQGKPGRKPGHPPVRRSGATMRHGGARSDDLVRHGRRIYGEVWSRLRSLALTRGYETADERTRTSTGLPPQAPEACASASSATSARLTHPSDQGCPATNSPNHEG